MDVSRGVEGEATSRAEALAGGGWLEEGIDRGGWWARTVGGEWESEAAGRVGVL